MSKFFMCPICGNFVESIVDSGVPMICCGQEMEEVEADTQENVALEKHIPEVKVEGHKVIVKVGSVTHPMLPEHFIVDSSRDQSRHPPDETGARSRAQSHLLSRRRRSSGCRLRILQFTRSLEKGCLNSYQSSNKGRRHALVFLYKKRALVSLLFPVDSVRIVA